MWGHVPCWQQGQGISCPFKHQASMSVAMVGVSRVSDTPFNYNSVLIGILMGSEPF